MHPGTRRAMSRLLIFQLLISEGMFLRDMDSVHTRKKQDTSKHRQQKPSSCKAPRWAKAEAMKRQEYRCPRGTCLSIQQKQKKKKKLGAFKAN